MGNPTAGMEKSSLDFWDGSWRANPKIKVDKIYPIPDKSNADSTCYYATVKTENVTFLDTPNGVPELYIYNRYHDDGKRVTCIGHEDENFDSKATYEYEFYLPKVYRDEFYYATPVVDGKFYDPEKFTRFGNTLEIKTSSECRSRVQAMCSLRERRPSE